MNGDRIDLGSVIIAGGLETIDAGDADLEKPGLSRRDLYRFGAVGAASSDISRRVGTVMVDTEWNAPVFNVTGAADEGIGSFTVTGSFAG